MQMNKGFESEESRSNNFLVGRSLVKFTRTEKIKAEGTVVCSKNRNYRAIGERRGSMVGLISKPKLNDTYYKCEFHLKQK
jgi:hypothetical protein